MQFAHRYLDHVLNVTHFLLLSKQPNATVSVTHENTKNLYQCSGDGFGLRAPRRLWIKSSAPPSWREFGCRSRSRERIFALGIFRAEARIPTMERVVKKSRHFREADQWNVRQNLALTAEQRIQIAHALRRRVYPADAKDVRECQRAS